MTFDIKSINEYTGGILMFCLTLITLLVSLVTGTTWAIFSAIVLIVIIFVVFIVVLWRHSKLIQQYERFMSGKDFKTISLNEDQTFNLSRLGSISGAPYGYVQLGCIPFEILAEDNRIQFLQIKPSSDNARGVADILVNLDNVLKVFLLVNVNYGLKSWFSADDGWDEKIVGYLSFEFQDGTRQEQELKLGYQLRDMHPRNQPWAVEKLRSKQAKNVWLGPDKDIALDMLKVELQSPKFIRRIVVTARLDVENFVQVTLGNQLVGPPEIRIYGVTCWLNK